MSHRSVLIFLKGLSVLAFLLLPLVACSGDGAVLQAAATSAAAAATSASAAATSAAAVSARAPAPPTQPASQPQPTAPPATLPRPTTAPVAAPPTQPVAPITKVTSVSSANPRLFFTDLESGPNTGGQDNLGAFVTIYGEGFGTQRGSSTVTIGGKEVAKYVIWGEDNAPARKMDLIVVQLGANVTSGNLVVTVNGKASNPLPFAVRGGQIYFVIPEAANANDANPGTFAQPFKTIYRPKAVMQAGDIVYIKGGVISTMDPAAPGWDTILMLRGGEHASGTAARPVAYLGYPGESPVLGSPSARRGLLLLQSDGGLSYYVIGNLTFTQAWEQLPLSGIGHRVIGNYFHDGAVMDGAAIGMVASSQIKVFGNLLRHNGEPGNKFVHGLYIQGFGTVSDIDFGWNQVQDHRGGRAIQLYGHQPNDRIDQIRIHDNLIVGSELNNLVLGGSDGGTEVLGTIYVYNNIVVGSGTEGLRVNDPQGTIVIQNNVFYNNGQSQILLERAGAGKVTLQNNILYAQSGQLYYSFESGAQPTAFKASHNLCFNAGVCASWDGNSINADPLFVDVAAKDFRVKSGSPAIDAGTNTGVALDYTGVSRPQGRAFDIGAYEFAAPGGN